jgi:hypothetical protein
MHESFLDVREYIWIANGPVVKSVDEIIVISEIVGQDLLYPYKI